jgi:hypothetical protein
MRVIKGVVVGSWCREKLGGGIWTSKPASEERNEWKKGKKEDGRHFYYLRTQ